MKQCYFFYIICVAYVTCEVLNEKEEDLLVRNILKKAEELTKKSYETKKKDVVNKPDLSSKRTFHHDAPSHEDRVIQGRCDINKKCSAGEYCDGMYCFKCKGSGDHCDLNGECCEGAECQYGFCAKGAKAGDPGTYCDLVKDCKGKDICCIHEMSISHHHSICKPMLDEHESCGPINLFHQDVMKAHIEPVCGPCKPGLSCKGVGILGRHSICLPEGEE